MEKRGYVKAGPWTPEVVMEHPEAGIFFYMIYFSCKNLYFKKNSRYKNIFLKIIVEGLLREFLRAGADVMQAPTFYASDDKLDNRGNTAGSKYSGRGINLRASELAKKVAKEGGALTLGGICQCPTYLSNVGKEAVQEEFRKQIQVFVEADLDFLMCEVTYL